MGGITTTLFQRPRDPQYNLTTLLLPGNGTNGAQNNAFLDSSSNNFSITRNPSTGPNAPTQGTFSPFSQTGWSNYFDGSDSSLSLGGQTAFSFGTGDWTVEFWMYFTATGGTLFDTRPAGTASTNGYSVLFLSSGSVRYDTASGVKITGSTLSANTWYHVALCKASGTTRLFINGVQDGSSYTDSVNYGVGANRPIIGADGNSPTTVEFTGYLSNYRILKGTGLYTTTFTPPTSSLTNITNTSLLTCQSNRFVDNGTANSGSGFSITVNGTPSVQAFSPFAPSGAYTTTAVGGSGYFDGTGDYLNSTITAFGSGNFTIECWVYFTASVASKGIFHVATSSALPSTVSGVALASGSAGGWTLYYNNGSQNTTATLTAAQNTWIHLAVVKSGTTIRVYVDGVMNQSQTDTANYTSQVAAIGGFFSTAYLLTGYISGFKVTSTADYSGTSTTTANFTLPTAPPSPTSSILCCNFTNAGITDATAKNDLETVGNAQISTTQSKFGGSSMSFDGTGDYIVEPTNLNFGYGTGDFTIEFWLRLNSTATQTVVSNLTSASSVNPHLYILSGGSIRYYTNNADRITGSTLSTGQWYHIAVARSGTSTKLFIDGTQSGSTYTDSNNYGATAPLGIGTFWSSGTPSATDTLNGYIDDLRITKGFARYTANFNVPTIAFPTQ